MEPRDKIIFIKNKVLDLLTETNWDLPYKNTQSMVTAIEAKAMLLNASDKLKKIIDLEEFPDV